jgi:hypothetical protein
LARPERLADEIGVANPMMERRVINTLMDCRWFTRLVTAAVV